MDFHDRRERIMYLKKTDNYNNGRFFRRNWREAVRGTLP